jgi:sporulation protein YlmC with PRC-barrel domain
MNSQIAMKFIVTAICGIALVGGAAAQQKDSDKQRQQQAQNQQEAQKQRQQQAQNQQSQDGQKNQQSQNQKKDAAGNPVTEPVAGVMPLGATVVQTEMVAKGWRASKLLRGDVYNDQGQKIGKVEDMVIAPDGTLSLAVIDVGGFLGVGKHRVAIPVDHFASMAPRIVLPGATKEELKKLPEFIYTT